MQAPLAECRETPHRSPQRPDLSAPVLLARLRSRAGLSAPPPAAGPAPSEALAGRGGSGGTSSDREGSSSKPRGWEISISSKFPRDTDTRGCWCSGELQGKSL